MPARSSLVFLLLLIGSLAFLAALVESPHAAGSATVALQPSHLRPALAPQANQPTIHASSTRPIDAPQASALAPESEEQDPVDTRTEAQVPTPSPFSLHRVADRQPIVLRAIPSLYPLRC